MTCIPTISFLLFLNYLGQNDGSDLLKHKSNQETLPHVSGWPSHESFVLETFK